MTGDAVHLATTSHAESLELLAARVYDLGEQPSSDAAAAAAKALVEANPFLRQIDDVPAGTVIDVPPLDGATPAAGATRSEQATAASAVADRIGAAAALAQRQLLADIEAELEDARATVKLGDSDKMRQLKRETAGLEEALPQTVAAAEARVGAAEELRERQRDVFAQIARDLGELSKAFGK
jgi:hypothetical protein